MLTFGNVLTVCFSFKILWKGIKSPAAGTLFWRVAQKNIQRIPCEKVQGMDTDAYV
jgi:hypothetical protein